MKLLRRLVISVLAAFAVVAVALIFLLTSEAGLRWSVTLAAAFAPGELTIGRISGQLVGPITLRDLHYQNGEQDITLERFAFDWRPWQLLREQRLHITRLDMENLAVRRSAQSATAPVPDDEPFRLPDLNLPVNIEIDQARIAAIKLIMADGTQQRIDRVELTGHLDDRGLYLEPLAVSAPDFGFTATGELQARGESIGIEMHWWAELPDQPRLSGEGSLSGALDALQIRQQMHEPMQARLHGRLDQAFTAPTWSAKINLPQLTLNQIRPDWPDYALAGELIASGDTQTFSVQADLDSALAQTGALDVQAELHGEYAAPWIIDRLDIRLPGQPAELHVAGSISRSKGQPQFQLKGNWQALQWPLREATPLLTSSRGEISIAGPLEQLAITLDADIDPQRDDVGGFAISARAQGQGFEHWQIEHAQVTKPDSALRLSGSGSADRVDSQWRYQFTGDWQSLRWPSQGQARVSSPRGRYRVSGTEQAFAVTLDGTVDPQRDDIGIVAVSASVKGAYASPWRIDQATISLPGRESRVLAQGELRRGEDQQLVFDLAADWQSLQWPLQSAPWVTSPQGHVTISGMPQQYALDVNARIESPQWPGADMQLQGEGSTESLQIAHLTLRTLDGTIETDGRVAWSPTLSWSANIRGEHLNPATIQPQWPGDLQVQLTTHGEMDSGAVSGRVDLQRLSGQLRGRPLHGAAAVIFAPGRYAIESLAVESGESVVNANGLIGERSELNWSLRSADLRALWPGLSGSLTAQGRINGTLEKPAIQAEANGESIGWNEILLERIDVSADIDLAGQRDWQLTTTVVKPHIAEHQFDQLRISATGSATQHEANVTLARGEDEVLLGVRGSYLNQRWSGLLQQAEIAVAPLGRWRLNDPSPLLVSAQQWQLQRSCLQQNKSDLCLEFSGTPAAGSHVVTSISELPIGLFKDFMPPDVQWQGVISGRLQADYADGRADADGRLQILPGSISLALSSDQTTRVEYQGGEINLHSGGDGTRADVHLVITQNNYLRGQLNLPNYRLPQAPDEDQPLQGALQARHDDLEFLPLVITTLAEPQGQLSVNLQLAGTVGAPQVLGELKLNDGSVDIAPLGIRLTDIRLAGVSRDGNTIDWTGDATSGPGSVQLKGETHMDPQAGWPTTLNLIGKDFQVARQPGRLLIVSPNLNAEIKTGELRLQGAIGIPRANIEIQGTGSGAVTASEDVRVIGRGKDDETATPWRSFVEVRIVPGDRVNFEGYGLIGRIGGDLVINRTPDKPLTATGNLQVLDGTYSFFDNRLDIRQGTLTFANSALDNPGLDLRAVRVIQEPGREITAGIQARGRLKSPQITLFSEPAMDDTSVLSYLILGRGALESGNQSESNLLMAAAAAIGTSNAYRSAKRFAQSIGFEDVSVNNEGVVLGKTLSRGLYVSYEIDLVNPVNTLKIQYLLNKNWTVEAQSSEHSGADLIYTIEH